MTRTLWARARQMWGRASALPSADACPNEGPLLEAIADGRSIDADRRLAAHLADCPGCRELAGIASVLAEDGAAARAAVGVPPAGQVWWRAELRARQEAARRVQRPMTLVQAVAAACTIGVLLALVTLTWPFVAPLVRVELPASGPSALAALGLSGHWLRLAFAVAALWLIAGPLAVYFVLRGERH